MTTTPTTQPPPALDKLLWREYMKLVTVRSRLYFLRAFRDELERVTRGKDFRVHNDILWRMVLDHRDKCVIDLASIARAMRHGMPYENSKGEKTPPNSTVKQGLFALLRAHHTNMLSRTYVPDGGDDDTEIAANTETLERRFRHRFPGCGTDSPSDTDIDDLCIRFQRSTKELADDRAKNRAHAYEGDLGQVKMLDLDELDSLFEDCESLLVDLSLMSGGSYFGGDNMNMASCARTARTLVDQVLVEEWALAAAKDRDELYARLHEIYANEDSREIDGPQYFNDCLFTADAKTGDRAP